MTYTKRELVTKALSAIGIASYEFDADAEQIDDGVEDLDGMMALWSRKGIDISYNFSGGPSEESGIPPSSYEAVITNLSLRLAPSYGKEISREVRKQANVAKRALYAEAARPIEMQYRTIPIGAAHKSTWWRFDIPRDKYPWKIETFDDYSGGKDNIHIGDVGVTIPIDLTDIADLSTATDSSIQYRKPSGLYGSWDSTIVGNIIQYTTINATDLDEVGVWYIQATYSITGFTGSSNTKSFRVLETIANANPNT